MYLLISSLEGLLGDPGSSNTRLFLSQPDQVIFLIHASVSVRRLDRFISPIGAEVAMSLSCRDQSDLAGLDVLLRVLAMRERVDID